MFAQVTAQALEQRAGLTDHLLSARLLLRELLRRLLGARGELRFERVLRLEPDFLPARVERELLERDERALERFELDEADFRLLRLRLAAPPFLPPPSCLLTVAQARRSASGSEMPRSS